MPAPASDPKDISASHRWRNARPVWGFVSGVYSGGFLAWVILTPIVVVESWRYNSSDSAGLADILFTFVFGILYCTMIVVVFFLLPMLALWLGRTYPQQARQIIVTIATISSLLIWSACLYLMGLSSDPGFATFTYMSVSCSILGGAVAGNMFWRRSFPPLDHPPGIQR